MKTSLLWGVCGALALAARPALAQGSLVFTALLPLPVPHYGMGYCNTQTAIYQVGGGSNATAYTGDAYRYSLIGNVWAAGTTGLTLQRWTTAAILDPNPSTSLIYVLNGQNSTGAPVPLLESVSVLAGGSGPSTTNPQPTASAGSAVWNGVLYCYGGSNSGVYANALRAYNYLTDTWTTLAPMPEAKETRGAAVNGKIYAFGGYNGVVNSSRVDAYDIATNQWQALGTLPATVSNQAVAVQGEWIWLVGDFNNQSYLAAYNTRTAQLRTFTSNLPPRRNAGAAVVNDQLYVWGGNTASANSSALADMWRADVLTILLGTAPAAALPVLQAYPNPLVGSTLRVVLPSAEATQLTVCDAQGREVRRQSCAPGTSTCELDLAPLAAGFYLVRVEAAGRALAACRLARQ